MPKRRNYISNITDSNMHNERYSVAKPYSSTLKNQKRITANKIKEKLKELDDYLKKHSLKLSKVKIVECNHLHPRDNFILKITKLGQADDTMNDRLNKLI